MLGGLFLTDKQREVKALVEEMRRPEYAGIIKEVPQTQYNAHISAFNFTRNAFWNKQWDSCTTKARGLFIDTKNWRIVMRGFDKFFNVGEGDNMRFDNLFQPGDPANGPTVTLRGEVRATIKENGYLGMVSAIKKRGKYELVFAQKSRMYGGTETLDPVNASWYAGNFANMFRKAYSPFDQDEIAKFCGVNNVTVLFEVCDPVNDFHIIPPFRTYTRGEGNRLSLDIESRLVVIGIVYNEIETKELDPVCYEKLFVRDRSDVRATVAYSFVVSKAGEDLDFNKILSACTVDRGSAVKVLSKIDDNITSRNAVVSFREGLVLRDEYGTRVKIKSTYYQFFKRLRSKLNYFAGDLTSLIHTTNSMQFCKKDREEAKTTLQHYIDYAKACLDGREIASEEWEIASHSLDPATHFVAPRLINDLFIGMYCCLDGMAPSQPWLATRAVQDYLYNLQIFLTFFVARLDNAEEARDRYMDFVRQYGNPFENIYKFQTIFENWCTETWKANNGEVGANKDWTIRQLYPNIDYTPVLSDDNFTKTMDYVYSEEFLTGKAVAERTDEEKTEVFAKLNHEL